MARASDDRLAAELADLDAVERQLQRFRQSGAMEPDAVAKLLARVRDYRQDLLRPSAPARPITTGSPQVVAATVVPKPTSPQPTAEKSPALRTPQPAEHRAAALLQPAAPPQKAWTEVLAGFIEERNIRWAEFVGVLVGGLLIVGSSLALVVSFWDTLQETYLKFMVFVGYSSAVFGAGLFAHHRWKLAATGRGLLMIAMLLVPLNFVVMASLSPGAWGWQTAAVEVASLVIFAWLSALAAGVLVAGRRWPLVLAVLGNSALILLVARVLGPRSSEGMLLAAGCVPAALLAVATFGYTAGRPGRRLQAGDAGAEFTLLGMAAFASAVAAGILVTRGKESLGLYAALHCLAPSLVLWAWPILATGLRIMRGTDRGESLAAFRTAGTTVALLGVVLQLTAVALTWPQPLLLVVVGLLNAAILMFMALRYRFPVAHAGAMVCLALAYLAGFQLLADDGLRALQSQALMIRQSGLAAKMIHLIVSARSASSLCGLFLIFAAVAAWFARAEESAMPWPMGSAAVQRPPSPWRPSRCWLSSAATPTPCMPPAFTPSTVSPACWSQPGGNGRRSAMLAGTCWPPRHFGSCRRRCSPRGKPRWPWPAVCSGWRRSGCCWLGCTTMSTCLPRSNGRWRRQPLSLPPRGFKPRHG